MDMPVEGWRQAVLDRHSRRKFDDRPIDSATLDQLEAVCTSAGWALRDWSMAAKVVLVRSLGVNIFKGIVGGYGKIEGAPACLLFIADRMASHAAELAGYAGEGAILEATRLGLATCWVGGFFKRDKAAQLVDLHPNEEIVAVSPVGYGPDDLAFSEKLMKRMASSHKRRELTELAAGYDEETWPAWARTAAALARLAPSAMNRQPWRFRLEEEGLVLTLDDPKDSYHIPKRLDCGIAMLHVEVGARAHGVAGTWELLDGMEVARYRVTGEAKA